jgi:hypothetical protein
MLFEIDPDFQFFLVAKNSNLTTTADNRHTAFNLHLCDGGIVYFLAPIVFIAYMRCDKNDSLSTCPAKKLDEHKK